MRDRDTAPPAPGFWTLASVEGWERFAIQGAKSLLTLFLVTDLLTRGGGTVLGMARLRAAIEGVTGAHGDIAFASQLYGLYGALTYLVLPLGGWIADRSGQRRRAMYVGAALMTLGLLALASRSWALPGLAFLIGGIGLLKGNLAAEVGALRGGSGGERLYAAYLAFLNGGALLGPLIGGWLALRVGFAAAFVAMAGSMIAAILILRTAQPVRLVDVPVTDRHGTDWPRVILAIVAVTLCFCAYEQLTNMVLLWAEERVDLTIAGLTVPPSWLAAMDGLFTIALAMIAYRVWPRLPHEPDPALKLVAGGMAIALAYGLLAWLSGAAGAIGLGGPICVAALLSLGVVLSWPSALAIVAAAAPPSRRGLMTGLFYLHGFVAHLVVGELGALYPRMAQPHFWAIHAAFALAGAAVALMIPRGQATTTSTPASAPA
ncbi:MULTISPECIES: MFS transporter [Sphingomonas]|uniref:MFS transporter n=1 Tax=Sphingomonas zeae TaxID=1646122 RepID=A0A7Y6EHJ2_9SPHN|nr:MULTISPECIES: MFS transporter [Sphingomonas]MBB4048756.1 POT family proton-dependent oligopeptide transporter [Sphingomonas zeae]MDK8186097.1 MFS transporter [Sphingomonas zeae]MDK8215405.1 MFS transporter [Sphingomonas sp. UMB7805-LC452B]NUU47406.1 MFS transporter [Sphingomonas zeae]